MKATIEILKADLRRAIAYASLSAIFTIALAFGIASVVGNQVEDETNNTVQVILDESQHTRRLLCDVLIHSDNQDIRRAVKDNC